MRPTAGQLLIALGVRVLPNGPRTCPVDEGREAAGLDEPPALALPGPLGTRTLSDGKLVPPRAPMS